MRSGDVEDRDFDQLTLASFIRAYHSATTLCVLAGIISSALGLHRKLHTEARAKLDPPPAEPVALRVKEAHSAFALAFAPFMNQGKVTANPHAKEFMARVDRLYINVCRHLAKHPEESIGDVAYRLALADVDAKKTAPSE